MATPQKPSNTDKLNFFLKKAKELPKPAPAPRHEIDSVVQGSFLSNQLGEVFVVEQRYGADYLHGSASLFCSPPLGLISQWANDPRIAELPLSSFAFLDTETTGLAGGTGSYAFLVGVARFIDEEFVLRQYFMQDPADEPALLEGLANFLAPVQALVTFNGKTFDIPLLTTRYTLHRLPIPYKGYAHLDLLPLARRLWRDRLESRALKHLEAHILGLQRASEEVHGSEIPYLYFDYLDSRDARPLAGVFYHNAMDMAAMAALLTHMNEMITHPYEGPVEHGLDFIALGKLFEELGRWEEAARLFERGLQCEITESDFQLAVRRLSILQKRRGDLEEAVRLWEKAAAEGQVYAYIEIAKYYEHKRRDVKSALHWSRAALEQLERSTTLPAYVRSHWRDEIAHRLARLERKDGI